MARLTMGVTAETLRLVEPFHIAGHVFEDVDALVVTLSDGDHRGRGEAAGVYYMNDDLPAMLAALKDARDAIEAGPTRAERISPRSSCWRNCPYGRDLT